MIARAFDSLQFSRIVASASDTNERALELLQRLGFRVERNGRADPETGLDSPGVIGFLGFCQKSGLDPDFGHRRGKKLPNSESGGGHRKTRIGGLFDPEP